MRAKIEIDLDLLLGRVSQESLRMVKTRLQSGGVAAIDGLYITHRDSDWFIDAARRADIDIRSTLSATITTDIDDISDSMLIYNIECRDEPHGESMALLLERALVDLICNRWYKSTWQPLAKYDSEVLAELKSSAHIIKRVRRKYSIY